MRYHQADLRAAGRHVKEPPNIAFLECNAGYRVLRHCSVTSLGGRNPLIVALAN
jgi:hypothetical protein